MREDLVRLAEHLMAGEKPKERFCVDCAHFATDGTHMCMRPVTSLVTGQVRELAESAHMQRIMTGGGCGEEGRYWQVRKDCEPGIGNPGVGGMKYAQEDDGA